MTQALERHYSVGEIATLRELSERTIGRILDEESGIVRLGSDGNNRRRSSRIHDPQQMILP